MKDRGGWRLSHGLQPLGGAYRPIADVGHLSHSGRSTPLAEMSTETSFRYQDAKADIENKLSLFRGH
jgi:hypothetical protein